MSNSLGEAVLDLTADTAKMLQDIDKAKPEALSALDNLGKMGGALLAAGLMVAATAIVTITTMVWDAGNTLDAAYDTIQQRTGATGEQLQQLKGDFDAVFSSVPATAEDAATAISIINQRLGLTGPALQEASQALLEMTRITGGDLLTNGEAFTRMVGDWGIATEDTAGALDAVFVASQQTGTGVDRLMQLVVQFGAPMRSFGFSFEESIAMLGKWEKEGVNTELVMGSLRIAAGKFANENIPLQDGLKKTFDDIKNAKDASAALAIAMDVFGARAGPDMAAAIRENRFELGDLVSVLENADGAIMQTAEDTMDWGERWTLFKNRMTAALGPAGMGLMDAVGEGLKAIEDVVSRPDVQAGIMAVVDGIVWLAQQAALALPVLIDGFFQFVSFLQTNQPVLVAILAAIGAAIMAFVYTTVIPAAISVITAIAPILLIMAAVAAIAYLVYRAWTENWGGIQEKLTAVWAWLQPIFQSVKDWLAINIPIALQYLSNLWTGTLLPAIQAVWGWMSGTLFPFLQALGNFISAVFSVAIRAMAGIWQNVVEPALKKAWEILNNKLMPVFQRLVDFWNSTLKPVLTDMGKWVQDKVVGAFDKLTTTMQKLKNWLNEVATTLKNLTLPAWMTPGSPTPWEIGLWGVNRALKAVSQVGLPALNTSMAGLSTPVAASNMTNNAYTSQMTFNFRDTTLSENQLMRVQRKMQILHGIG